MSRYIEADELEAFFAHARRNIDKKQPDFFTRDSLLLNAEQMTHSMPTADVQKVKHGKWIKIPSATHKDICFYDCSLCKHSLRKETDKALVDYIEWNGGVNLYCPHCGAKMDGDDK